MKKKKNNNEKKSSKYIGLISLILFLVVIIVVTIIIKMTPAYNISDRTQNVAKKQQVDDTVVAWIRTQGTNIDYPVIYSYTEKFENEEYNYSYAWTNSTSTKLNERTLIWGHNIRNVSSSPLINQKEFNNFENLPSYLYYDFVKENKYIQYTIDGKNYLFKIFSVAMVEEDNFNNSEGMNTNEKKEYIEKSKETSYFDFDVETDPNKKIITLATCTRFGGIKNRIIKVDGILVEKNEKINNYKVRKKDNYKEMEKTMKGDVENDNEEA